MKLKLIAREPTEETWILMLDAAWEAMNRSEYPAPYNRMRSAITAAFDAAPHVEQTPMAHLVMNEQGYIVCAYRELNLAERLVAKGHLTHNEKIVPVYGHPHIETEAEKRAKEFNVRVARYLLQLSPHIHGKLTARLLEEANKIIRALLAERRKHGT